MRKSSFLKGLAYATALGIGSMVGTESAYAQQDTTRADTTITRQDSAVQQDTVRTQPNTIYSFCPQYSVTGEGVVLKNFVFNESGSERNLEDVVRCLYSRQGDISLDTTDAIRGLDNVLNYLVRGNLTPEKIASIEYIKGLAKRVSESDDYGMLIARSPGIAGYHAQSVGILFKRDSSGTTDVTKEQTEITEEKIAADKAYVEADASEKRDRNRGERTESKERTDDNSHNRLRINPVFSVGLGTGKRGELFSEGSAGFGTRNFSVGGFGQFYFAGGRQRTITEVSTPFVQTQAIGATTKTRIDSLTTTHKTNPFVAYGGQIVAGTDGFALEVRAGRAEIKDDITEHATSTITFDREGVSLREPETIEGILKNSEGKQNSWFGSIGAMLRLPMGFYFKAFGSRANNKNSFGGSIGKEF